jgi:hypothetical protein
MNDDELTPEAKLERMMKMLKLVVSFTKQKYGKQGESSIIELNQKM